ATERARGRLRLAMDAVRAYHTGVSEDVLLRQPEMKSIQSRLLQSPLAFYEGLRADLESSPDATVDDRRNLADAYVNLARLNERIGSESVARAALLEAAEIEQRLVKSSHGSTVDRAAQANVWLLLGVSHSLRASVGSTEASCDRSASML